MISVRDLEIRIGARVLMSGDGVVPRVDGRIEVPGEVDRYVFTLASDVKVVFDSLNEIGCPVDDEGELSRVGRLHVGDS